MISMMVTLSCLDSRNLILTAIDGDALQSSILHSTASLFHVVALHSRINPADTCESNMGA